MRRISEGRKSIQSASISPEEMTKLKNRLVTMIKSEQEDNEYGFDKPFKKTLKKKIAKYEQRLKNRNMVSMKTQKYKDNSKNNHNDSMEDEPKEETKGLLFPKSSNKFSRKGTHM